MAHGDHDPKVLEQKKIDSQFLGLPASKTKFAMDLWVMEGKLITTYFVIWFSFIRLTMKTDLDRGFLRFSLSQPLPQPPPVVKIFPKLFISFSNYFALLRF